jgi:hypothetical protein
MVLFIQTYHARCNILSATQSVSVAAVEVEVYEYSPP